MRLLTLMHWIVAHATVITGLLLVVAAWAQWVTHGILRCRWHHWCGSSAWWPCHRIRWGTCRFFSCIQIRFLLGLTNILLVANSFVSKPIGNLWHSNTTFTSQFFFGLFRWIGIAQVTVKVFIQNLRCLFAEISSFSASIQEARSVIKGKRLLALFFKISKNFIWQSSNKITNSIFQIPNRNFL